MFRQQVRQAAPGLLVAAQEPLAFLLIFAILHQRAEIVDRDMVDIGRVIPGLRDQPGHRHPAAKQQRRADPPMGEIGEADKGLLADPQQLIEHDVGTVGGLQSLAENRIVEAAVGIRAEVGVGVALHHG